MASTFSRKKLDAMGLTDEQKESLIELHMESVNALKSELEKYKDDADKLSEVQEELKKAKAELESAKKDDYKGKYESEKAAHDKLKNEIQSKETTAKKTSAFKAMLKEKGYSENAINKITKFGGYVDGVQFDDEGKMKDTDKLIESIEKEWSEYKPVEGKESHTPPTPHKTEEKPKNEIAAAMQKFTEKYNYDHYGVKPDSGNSAAKEE